MSRRSAQLRAPDFGPASDTLTCTSLAWAEAGELETFDVKINAPALKVSITRFVDEDQPGFVECQFFDADGERHIIIEKVPVVSKQNLWSDSEYPRDTDIDCIVLERFTSPQGARLVRIDTELPWHIESTSGQTVFVVQESQITDTASG